MVLNSKLVLWIILILSGCAYGSNRKKYYVSESQFMWLDARDACRAKGMVLACTTTSAEKNDLENYIRGHFLAPEDVGSGYWIGSHRNSINTWIWESNGQRVGTFGWISGEPNDDSKHCMEFKKDTTIGWNNVDCGSTRRYICESPSHDPDTSETDNSITTVYPKKTDNKGSNNGNSHTIYFIVAVFCFLLLILLCAAYIITNHICIN